MFTYRNRAIVLVLCLLYLVPVFAPIARGQDETAADEKIIERYKLMLERKPKEGSTFDRLYQFYLEGAGLEQMVADYQTEAEAKPNDPNIQLILGHIYKRLGKDAETLAAYQRAVELAPNDYYPHVALGGAYAMLRRHEDAIAALTQAAELSTASQTATIDDLTALYKALGRAYFSRDRVDQATSAWGKIAEIDPRNIFARIELADLFREQELYDQAIAQHQAIAEIKKDDPYRVCLSHREIGKIQEQKGDYQDALASYDEALVLTAPGNWLRKDLQHRIVGMYAADGNWEGLITYYQEKLETTPNDPELMGLLASAYIENQQLDEGIASYRKGLELAPTDANLRLNLIAAFRNAERFEEAAAEYETLSEGHPDDFGIYRELGELYLQLGAETQARGAYQRMIDRDPNNAGTHLILAEIYAGHEWFDDAVAAFEQAISLAPKNLDYLEYLGEFYLRQGNREKTVETWNRMVEGKLEMAANYHRLAQLLETKEFHTEAIAASRKAVELRPDEYRYREALARQLMESKEYDEALTQYTEAAKRAPNEFFAEQMGDQQIEIYRRQGTLVEKLEALEGAPETFNQQKQLAKMYLKLGNISYAIEALTKAQAFQPNDVRVNRWLAEIYAQQGQRDKAVPIYTYLVEIDAENAREYYTAISRSHLKVMDFDAATDAAKQAVAHSPRNPEGHHILAEIAKQVGDYETATDSLKQAIRLRPEATNTRAELAALYKLVGNFRQAIEQYWRCWELSDSVGGKLGFVKSLSETYYDLGRGREFEEKLKQMSKAKPSDMGPVLALAEVYRMGGDLPSARFQLVQALDRERDNPELLGQLVKISSDLGDMQDALGYQQRLVKAQPDPIHQQRLGELLFDAGREQEAIQAWTKLLHAKNQTFEAEAKLATLLIRYGLLEDALSVLERAGEKVGDAKEIYQVGATLVEMNEYDRAQSYFERILQMPKPPENATTKAKATVPRPTYDPPGIDTRKFNLAQSLVRQIQQQPYGRRSVQPWSPSSFEEAQAGALVQLMTIAQQQGKLSTLIGQLEADTDANPKDIQSLERLAQIYTLTGNTGKVKEITNRLIVASPKDLTYQAIRLNQLMAQNPDYETLQKQLDEMTGLMPQTRLWYIAQYAHSFYRQGRMVDATKLLDELEDVKVTDLDTGFMLVNILVLMDKIDEAERFIAQLPVPMMSAGSQTSAQSTLSFSQRQWWQYNRIYQPLATAYIRRGQIDKGVELFIAFFERTKPHVPNARRVASLLYSSYSYGGYRPVQSNYPSPTIYYDQDRLRYLQQVFIKLWRKNELEALYIKLQNEFETAEGRNRIYPGLGLSYCHWWAGKRDKAQEILSVLRNEFPDDLTLKLHTVLVSIQTGQHKMALGLLDELAEGDPRNRHQYYDLTLQLATHTGNTIKVRELMMKMLNSGSGARELYQFSQKLRGTGFTQYALAVAQKAVSLAMGQRDPNFLMELSQHLEQLGRGQDATRIAEHAMRLANQRGRHGQTLHPWNFQRAMNLIGRPKTVRERELIEVAQKHPDSFQAQIQLATFYESTKQVKKASAAFNAALALRPKDGMTRQRYAQMLQHNGHLADAVAQYTMLLKKNPNALGHGYGRVVETFFQANKADELISLAKGMITPTIGQPYTRDFAHSVARQCIQRNLPKVAIEIYEKIIEVHSNQYNTYVNLASAYAATGEREKAIQFLREKLETQAVAISQNPYVRMELVSKLAEFYKAAGEIQALVTEYEAKLAEKPEDQSLLYLVASMKISANDLEGSDPLVNQLLDVGTMNTNWLHNLAVAYRDANDLKRELHLLETATEKLDSQNPWQLPEVYQKLGVIYAQNGEKEKAQSAVRKMGVIRLLRGGGGNYWNKEHIARIYMQHEMWDDAEAMYLELLNNPSFNRSYWRQVQEQLMTVKQRKSGESTTTQLTQKTEDMPPGMQRILAQQYMDDREFSKAAELYKQIIAAVPEDLVSRAQLAKAYLNQNKHDAAIAEWKGLLEADPENTKYQDGLITAYQAANKTDMAIKLAQQYIEVEENSVHYIRLAKVYVAAHRVDEAIEAYQKAIELTLGNVQVYHELARLYLRKDDLDAAEKTFKEALQHTGQEWERRRIEREIMGLYRRKGTLVQMLQQAEAEGTLTFEMQQEQAKNYHAQGKLEKAAEAYKKVIDLTTQGWEKKNFSTELVAIYAQLGQTEAALELYETLSRTSSQGGVSINSSGASFEIKFGGDETRQNLINAYQNSGKLDDLLAHLKRHLETDADNPATLEIIAEIHRTRGDDAKAAESYQQLCKAQPGNVRSFYYAAAALNKIRQPELAQKLVNEGDVARSLTNQWNRDMLHSIALGDICVKGELYDTAIQLLEAAESGLGGESDQQILLNHLLAQAYLGTNRYADAAKAYQQMADVARNDYMKTIAEEGLRKAHRAENLSEQLIEEGTQAVEGRFDDPDTHFVLAQAYELKGMPDAAIAAYERAMTLNPNSTGILEPLAKLYANTDPEKAKPLYKRLIKLADTVEARIQNRRALIDLYKRQGEFDTAITELLDTVHFAPERIEHSVALRSLWNIYVTQERTEEGIATLEELVSHLTDNPVLYEVLGDAYKETGDSEKAETAYTQWIERRQKEIERQGDLEQSFPFVWKLLVKQVMPEKALELAERVSEMEVSPFMIPMLGEAYLVNGRYAEAEAAFKRALANPEIANIPMPIGGIWSNLMRAAQVVEDTEQFAQLVATLVENMPPNDSGRVYANLALSLFHRTHNRPEEAEQYMRKSAVVPESAWWIIGPFGKTDMDVDTRHILEDTVAIDPTVTYDGKTGAVSWKQMTDETRDSFVDFGQLFGFGGFAELIERLGAGSRDPELESGLAYAWVSVKVPDQRQAQIRISTLNTAKIWLNRKAVLTINQGEAEPMLVPHHTASVTLNAGENSILVKVSGEQLGWQFNLWLTDPEGKSLEDLTFPKSNR